MKRLAVFCSILSILAFSPAFARGYRHNGAAHGTPSHGVAPTAPPVATSTPISIQPTPISTQFGFFLPPVGVQSAYTMEFTDGAFIGSGNDVIFLEPPFSDSAIVAGQFDVTLKSFATSAAKYQNIILALGEEANCAGSNDPWSIGKNGNTIALNIEAIQYEAVVVREYDPAIKIAQDLNADNCNGTYPTASYFASGVDFLGLDDFSDGSVTWSQLFQPAINNLKGLGKPIDILSEGASSNQAAFVAQTVAGATANGINLVLWFNAGSYAAPASTLSQL